jgi:hypothetical protein
MNMYLLLLFLTCFGTASQVLAVELSESTNGLYLAVGGWRHGPTAGSLVTNEPIRFDDMLVWYPFFKEGKVEINYPNMIYGVKIKMFDSSGKELSKTALGRSCGSKWDELHSYNDTKLGSIDAWGEYDCDQSWRFLASANDLFEIEKPGIYTLELQMQMFRHSGSFDPVVWSKNLIRFSPIKIRVERPLVKLTNHS